MAKSQTKPILEGRGTITWLILEDTYMAKSQTKPMHQ